MQNIKFAENLTRFRKNKVPRAALDMSSAHFVHMTLHKSEQSSFPRMTK